MHRRPRPHREEVHPRGEAAAERWARADVRRTRVPPASTSGRSATPARRSITRRTWRWPRTARCTSPMDMAMLVSIKFSPDGVHLVLVGRARGGPGAVPRAARDRRRARTARSSWPTARTAASSSSAPTASSSRNGPSRAALPGPRRRASGDVYVAELGYRAGMWPGTTAPSPDATGGRVSVFDRDGRLLARWGGGSNPMCPGRLLRAP